MFGLFKRKSKKEQLQTRYKKLLEEAYQLSHSNRRKSDEKTAQAEEIRKQLEAMED